MRRLQKKKINFHLEKLEIPVDKDYIEKPYPNEHACRLASPGQFSRFARKSRQSSTGKTYDVIFGFLAGGGSKEQAYRYNKDSWTADEARSHCSSHDGSFEAASVAKFETAVNKKFQFNSFVIDEDETVAGISFKKGQELRYVMGVVLEPEMVDATTTKDSVGDIYNEDEVRKAAHFFMLNYSGKGNDFMHDSKDSETLKVVESFIAPVEMQIGSQMIKKGTWLMATLVLDDEVWKKVKNGEIGGYSIGGTAHGKLESA